MKLYSKTQILLSILMFITINVLFYFKYAYRISPSVSIVSVFLYILFTSLLIVKYSKIKTFLSYKRTFVLIVLFVIASIIVLFYVPKDILRVDRWEMVEVFWDAVSQGIYPYGESSLVSGNHPGPMPFYFIICYPFYLIGEIGYAAIAGILLWLYHAWKKYKNTTFVLIVLLMFSSLSLYWEIVARSTVFLNSCLFSLYLFNLKGIKKMSPGKFYFSAILGGLLFSTRNIFALVLIIWGLFVLFRKKVKFARMIKWGLCFLISFIATFIPFILMDPSGFIKINPFIIQSSVLIPFTHVLFFVTLAFIFYFFCKKFTDVIFYSGLIIFLTISWYAVFRLYTSGIQALLDAEIDISYYIFCFPFLLEVIAHKKYDKR